MGIYSTPPTVYQAPAQPPPPSNAPLVQFAPGVSGLTQQQGSAALLTDNPDESEANQLNNLMQSSSPLEQLAQSMGMNEAAARGSANGTLFAGASMSELNKNLQPVAANDANAALTRATTNANNINQMANVATQAGAETESAGISANASMENAKLAAEVNREQLAQQGQEFTQSQAQNQQQFTTNWDNTFKQLTQTQQFQQLTQQQQNEFAAKMTGFSTVLNTIFSDPSYWADGQGAMGAMNFFNNNMDDLLKQMGIG